MLSHLNYGLHKWGKKELMKYLIQNLLLIVQLIIIEVNGYDDKWIEEATTVRGLSNYKTTADAMPHLLDEKNVKMLTSHKVFTLEEIQSRTEIMLENYCKSVNIEANTMVQMAKTQVIPAIEKYAQDVAQGALTKKQLNSSIACGYEDKLVSRLSELSDIAYVKTGELEEAIESLSKAADVVEESAMIRDSVLAKMSELRAACDEAETLTAKSYWPFPTYSDLLFGV